MIKRLQNSEKAWSWLNYLNENYGDEIKRAIEHTSYDSLRDPARIECILNHTWESEYGKTEVFVLNEDVVISARDAIKQYSPARVCVLNFASYKNPGGGFVKGSMAQEEALCHSSALYLCLSAKETSVYKPRRYEKTNGLYSHDYIYSKDVPLIVDGEMYLVDILTMCAPNKSTSTSTNLEEIFKERMQLAYSIPRMNDADVVLLGAWGCGVFGNSPKFVAEQWKRLTELYDGIYKAVIHPVLDKKMFNIFSDVISHR